MVLLWASIEHPLVVDSTGDPTLSFGPSTCTAPSSLMSNSASSSCPDFWPLSSQLTVATEFGLGPWESILWKRTGGCGHPVSVPSLKDSSLALPIAYCLPGVASCLFPGGASDKESTCRFRRQGFDPCRRKWQPIPVFLPGESHGQRSLVGSSPGGSKRVGHNWTTEHRS